jgi:hypothetical protein
MTELYTIQANIAVALTMFGIALITLPIVWAVGVTIVASMD